MRFFLRPEGLYGLVMFLVIVCAEVLSMFGEVKASRIMFFVFLALVVLPFVAFGALSLVHSARRGGKERGGPNDQGRGTR